MGLIPDVSLAWDVMPDTRRGDAFSGGVAVLFGTYVFGAGIGIINGILLARLLGPAGKGDYYILVLVPTTAMVLLQFGLPQAFNFYSARGQTKRIGIKALVLTAALTIVAVVAMVVLLPLFRESILHDGWDERRRFPAEIHDDVSASSSAVFVFSFGASSEAPSV